MRGRADGGDHERAAIFVRVIGKYVYIRIQVPIDHCGIRITMGIRILGNRDCDRRGRRESRRASDRVGKGVRSSSQASGGGISQDIPVARNRDALRANGVDGDIDRSLAEIVREKRGKSNVYRLARLARDGVRHRIRQSSDGKRAAIERCQTECADRRIGDTDRGESAVADD